MVRALGIRIRSETPIFVRVPLPISDIDIVYRPYESNSGSSYTELYVIDENNVFKIERIYTISGKLAAFIMMRGTDIGDMVSAVIQQSDDAVDTLKRLNLLPVRGYYPVAVLIDVNRCHSIYCSSTRIIVIDDAKEERQLIMGRSIAEQGNLAVFGPFFGFPPDYMFIEYITRWYNHIFSYPVAVYDGFFGSIGIYGTTAIAIYVDKPLTISSPDHPGEEIILERKGWYILYHPIPRFGD